MIPGLSTSTFVTLHVVISLIGIVAGIKGFPHGMPTTEAATINADLLEFIKA